MGKLYDVVATGDEYTNKDGETKRKYITLGSVIETKNGQMLKLDSVPINWDGWAYLNEPKDCDNDGGSKDSDKLNIPF